ncbi:hypothetical protein COCVIDRAFT_15602 [Bipolaris victoriae FI3]|uniref:3-hydroxyacyl-CoA dehydrogenase NAD binding domain-containing protein n=1 Tax=Bipolaris victoriae (strain FI3) TaxID=930091 RepID=W7EAF7_BIPV3|nr:hypothetical protein COCVIDRAFT_15602 [Bipolaris victoriae FI3]
MAYHPPNNYRSRLVAILGAGYNVHVRDPSPEQRNQCLQYAAECVSTYQTMTGSSVTGEVRVFEEFEPAVSEAWLVIEAIPEKLDLKVSTFALLERSAPQDALLASNSSSYKSSEIVVQLSDFAKQRAFNMHYYMPPANMIVELMTDQATAPEIFEFLSTRLRETAAQPYIARKESTGSIFNRLWAAVKREILMIISEGVGLDTVALIEGHYVAERGLPSSHVDFLKAEYLDKGKLGNKSAKGGLFPK